MPWRAAPLKSSFMLAGIIGFLISVIYLPKFSLNFACGLVFLIMVIATLVSMTQSKPVLPLYQKKKK